MIKKSSKFKISFKRTVCSLILAFAMSLAPFVTACSGEKGIDGKNGQNGQDGTRWYSGTANIETINYGKNGDFYIDTNDYKLYQKNSNGVWVLVMDNFGKPGQGVQGEKGDNGTGYYTFVRYAKNSSGLDISSNPNGRNYICILTTTKENPTDADFTNWIKFVGSDGASGSAGTSSYTYIAFASDENGSDFSLTHKTGLKYIGIIISNAEIQTLQASNFAGKWIKFVGEDGKDGENGADGLTPYIGYDGYFWLGTERSENKAVEVLGDFVADNTIGLANNEYFESGAISAGTPIALMSNYFPNAQKTGYSGLNITSIQVYLETAGSLTISTASVNGVVTRTGSVPLKNSVVKTNLVKGLNTITFETPYSIPMADTLVLGASGDTASLVAYKGIWQEENQGSFANLTETGTLCAETNGVNDKVVCKVGLYNGEEVQVQELIPGLSQYMRALYNETGLVSAGGSVAGIAEVKTDGIPFSYGKLSSFENKVIDYIEVFATSVSAVNDNQCITVFLKNDSGKSLEYKFYAKKEDLGSTTPRKTIRLYRSESDIAINGDMVVEAGDYLQFWKTGDSVYFGFGWNKLMAGDNGFGTGGGISPDTKMSLGISVYGHDKSQFKKVTYNEHLSQLKAEETIFLVYETLKGKNVSILGDSISTFNGYSNVNTYNSDINTSQEAWFSAGNASMTSVDNTYWMRLINEFDMNLLVNESCGGDRITGNGYLRAENLEDNTTYNNPNGEIINPDMIFMHMGINDLDNNHVPVTCGTVAGIRSNLITPTYGGNGSITGYTYLTPTTFAEAYKIMLHKLTHLYGNVEIFCITLPRHDYKPGTSDNASRIAEFNSVITTLCAEYENVHVVPIGDITNYNNASGLTYDNIHPTNAGMEAIANIYKKVILEVFSKKVTN